MKKPCGIVFIPLFAVLAFSVSAQEYRLPLWDGAIPNSKPAKTAEKTEKDGYVKITRISNPDITVYLPTRRFASGQTVVICPGGGYVQLSIDLEGTDIARYLNSIGVAAVVWRTRSPGTLLRTGSEPSESFQFRDPDRVPASRTWTGRNHRLRPHGEERDRPGA